MGKILANSRYVSKAGTREFRTRKLGSPANWLLQRSGTRILGGSYPSIPIRNAAMQSENRSPLAYRTRSTTIHTSMYPRVFRLDEPTKLFGGNKDEQTQSFHYSFYRNVSTDQLIKVIFSIREYSSYSNKFNSHHSTTLMELFWREQIGLSVEDSSYL